VSDTTDGQKRPFDMPCGRCNCGTYAIGAVLAGLEQYGGITSRKQALKATPRCKTDSRHICFGDRDFVLAVDFPLTAARCAEIRAEAQR